MWPHAVAVADCTYGYIQKSSNVELQKLTWSEYKHCHLLKLFLLVAPDGYFMHIGGPYAPDNKVLDSDIFLQTITADEFKNWFIPKDTLLVDRGFNSIYQNPSQLDIVCPLFLNGNKQFSETESNYNRAITAFRWVVETANRRLREWKAVGEIIPNIRIKIMTTMFKVCAALENIFSPYKKANILLKHEQNLDKTITDLLSKHK